MKIEKIKVESGTIVQEKGMARVRKSNGDLTLTIMTEGGFIRFWSDNGLELRESGGHRWDFNYKTTFYKWENQ